MSHEGKITEIDLQEFSSPNRAIRSEPRTVEGHAMTSLKSRFDHGAYDMGVVVLDSNLREV